jgi:hypothetical protein
VLVAGEYLGTAPWSRAAAAVTPDVATRRVAAPARGVNGEENAGVIGPAGADAQRCLSLTTRKEWRRKGRQSGRAEQRSLSFRPHRPG